MPIGNSEQLFREIAKICLLPALILPPRFTPIWAVPSRDHSPRRAGNMRNFAKRTVGATVALGLGCAGIVSAVAADVQQPPPPQYYGEEEGYAVPPPPA